MIEEIYDILNHNYSNAIFSSRLYDIFCKKDEIITSYIKPNREFWHYDGSRSDFRKLKITYVRSGVMFFVFEDDPTVEHAWFMDCFNCVMLHAAQIYPHEIGKLLSNCFEEAEEYVPRICKQCKWDDCNGRITVEVIWDE